MFLKCVWLSLALAASVHAQVSTGAKRALDGSVASLQATRIHPQISARGGMVLSDDRVASAWGAEILKKGGNAVDAAVATAFALSVTRPHFASLGGGGFLIYCPPPKGGVKPACSALDYREKAPVALTRDAYVGADGKADVKAAQVGARASGVPGTVAGLLMAQQKWGKLSRKKILAQPILLARNGVRVTEYMEQSLAERWEELSPELKRVFSCGPETGRARSTASEKPCEVGQFVTQPELGRTLGAISSRGAQAFYSGPLAQELIRGLQAAGGVMTLSDLKAYQPVIREVLTARVGDQEIVTMPPPSSGGGVLVAILKFMERARERGQLGGGMGSAAWLRAFAYAESLAFADRAEFYGDPDFTAGLLATKLPQLLSDASLDARWAGYHPDGPWKNAPRAGAANAAQDGDHTTHFSVIDADGGAVALTTTINDSFGSGFMAPGTGIVMNNEIDDFSLQPGVPNQFGLVGSQANAIAPGKRPLSSMTPTITRDPASGAVRVVIGAAGGPRIISSVAQILLHRWAGMSLSDAVAAPRVHHQWSPDELKIERFGFAPEVRAALGAQGLKISESAGPLARAYGLERFENGRIWAAPDPRGEGEIGVAP